MPPFLSPFAPPLIPFLCVCVCLYDIDPHHATVTGLRVASAQGTTGTDSRWQRQRKTDPCKIGLFVGGIAGCPIYCVVTTHYVQQSKLFGIHGLRFGECVLILCPTICLPAGADVALWVSTSWIFTSLAKYTHYTTTEAHHNPGPPHTHTHALGLRLHSEGCHCSVQGHTQTFVVMSQAKVLTTGRRLSNSLCDIVVILVLQSIAMVFEELRCRDGGGRCAQPWLFNTNSKIVKSCWWGRGNGGRKGIHLRGYCKWN